MFRVRAKSSFFFIVAIFVLNSCHQKSRSVADVQDQIGERVRRMWTQILTPIHLPYPPPGLTLIGLKKEQILEVWANYKNQKPVKIKQYKFLASSGQSGPKLREGDKQIPEGLYQISGLNPNSSYHLSLKINYPNEFDWQHARQENRNTPGSDIFIHGMAVSIGCIAIGNEAIEELFILVADTNKENVQIILAPNDLRNSKPVTRMDNQPPWLDELYNNIRSAMLAYPN